MIHAKYLSYKGLEIKFNNELNFLEFIVDDSKVFDLESYIVFITTLVEYCEINNPRYVVINKENSNFILSSEMHDYTLRVIFSSLQSFKVKNIIMLVKPADIEKNYRNFNSKNGFMKGFGSREAFHKWIVSQKNA